MNMKGKSGLNVSFHSVFQGLKHDLRERWHLTFAVDCIIF